MTSTKRSKERPDGGWVIIRQLFDAPVFQFIVAFMGAIFGQKIAPETMVEWAAEKVRERLAGAVAIFCATMDGAEYIAKSMMDARQFIMLRDTVECKFDQGLNVMVGLVKTSLDLTFIDKRIFDLEWSLKGLLKIEMALFWFEADISTENAEKGMTDVGYDPAGIAHLLFFALLHPLLFLRFPLVALGSQIDGYSPFLDGWGGYRGLGLRHRCYVWRVWCRFLGVRK